MELSADAAALGYHIISLTRVVPENDRCLFLDIPEPDNIDKIWLNTF